jgi:hypothetical protein
MHKPVLTIFYQLNPWNSTIGGIQTVIRTFIKYAPSEFDVRLVGCSDKTQPIGRCHRAEFGSKPINFLALFALENDNLRGLIPTTVRYSAALLGRYFAFYFMHFHRLEPTLLSMYWQGEKRYLSTMIFIGRCKLRVIKKRFCGAYFQVCWYRNLMRFCRAIPIRAHYKQRYPSLSSRIA